MEEKKDLILKKLILTLLLVTAYNVQAETMDGMYYCMESNFLAIEKGKNKKYNNRKFTLKVKEGTLYINGDNVDSVNYGLIEGDKVIINPETKWIYASGFSVFSEFTLQGDKFALLSHFSAKNDDTNRTGYYYMSIGTCDKW